MAAATVVTAYKDGTNAYASFLVAEGGARGNVEYGPVSTPLLKPDASAKSAAEIKADLLVAATALRNAQLAPALSAQAGVSGAVTI